MYENILIPLDGSREAARALPYAVSFVRAFDANCTLLAVIPEDAKPAQREPMITPAGAPAQEQEPDYWLAAENWLAEAREHLIADEWIPASLEVRQGRPAEEILKLAREGNFDLIVLTVYGRGAAGDLERPLVIGSVADEVLRGANIPVLVIHPRGVSAPRVKGDLRPRSQVTNDA